MAAAPGRDGGYHSHTAVSGHRVQRLVASRRAACFERPTVRTPAGFDTCDLTVDLLIAADLTSRQWKDEGEYAHVRRLGIVSDTGHRAVNRARMTVANSSGRGRPFEDGAASGRPSKMT